METAQLTKAKWNVDHYHSEIQFKVKHLVISTVTGSFKKFDASIEPEGDEFDDAQISFSADINSINTGVADRDNHLKSDDFFSAEKFPQLVFKSTSLELDGSHGTLKGNLTIRDITLPVELSVFYGGKIEDQYKQIKVGFEVSGLISRKDFGLTWNSLTEAGGGVVADQVKIEANVQFIK
ncbi:MAG: YceI family protein [Bacteroidota bacterium]